MNYKNILITGGCGFIGTTFLNYFLEKYPQINFYNIDTLNQCSNNIHIKNNKNYTFINENLINKEMIKKILINNSIDAIVHFAAQTHVDNSYEQTMDFIKDNIVCTFNILECCREYLKEFPDKLKLMIYISTDEVYGDSSLAGNVECKTELSKLEPTNPYAATKASAEMMVLSYIHTYKLPIIITRGNNVYGSFQYAEKLIPKFIKLLTSNQKCTIHGSGTQQRSFIHVMDVCKALEIIMTKGKLYEVYNIGSDDEYTVLEITKKLIDIIKPNNSYNDWILFVEDRLYNDSRYYISYEKLKSIGYTPIMNFEEEFEKVVRSYLI